jgi:hypothetical protein
MQKLFVQAYALAKGLHIIELGNTRPIALLTLFTRAIADWQSWGFHFFHSFEH